MVGWGLGVVKRWMICNWVLRQWPGKLAVLMGCLPGMTKTGSKVSFTLLAVLGTLRD